MKRALFVWLILVVCVQVICAQTVTLTSTNDHVKVHKVGTVTFSGPNASLLEIAQREGLRKLSDYTYSAAIIYDVAFENGRVSSVGKIFNCTDNTIKIKCSYYNGSNIVAQYTIEVKPRTFSRIISDRGALSAVSLCNKIVCTELGASVGVAGNSTSNNTSKSNHSTTERHSQNSRFFATETVFYAQNSEAEQTVTYKPNGRCELIGYVLSDGYWIRGTSDGVYYMENGMINVTWDEWLHEKYRLNGNQYNNHGLIFRMQN